MCTTSYCLTYLFEIQLKDNNSVLYLKRISHVKNFYGLNVINYDVNSFLFLTRGFLYKVTTKFIDGEYRYYKEKRKSFENQVLLNVNVTNLLFSGNSFGIIKNIRSGVLKCIPSILQWRFGFISPDWFVMEDMSILNCTDNVYFKYYSIKLEYGIDEKRLSSGKYLLIY